MNGTHLSLWLRETRAQLSGSFVEDVRINARVVQVLLKKKSLYVSLYPDCMTAFVAKRRNEGYVTLSTFNTILRGLRIENVEQESFKPVIMIGFQKDHLDTSNAVNMSIYLYRDAPNIVVSKGKVYRKLYSRIVTKKPRIALWDLPEGQLAPLFSGDRQQIENKIVSSFEGIDQTLAKELDKAKTQYLTEVVRGNKKEEYRLVSVKPLVISFFATCYKCAYASLNELFKDATVQYLDLLRKEQVDAAKRKGIRNLTRRIDRLRKKMLTPGEIERYRIMGEAILSNLLSIKKGDVLKVLPSGAGKATLKIPLDPLKSPQANAQGYFRKYKKLKRGQPELKKKIGQLQGQLAQMQSTAWEPQELRSKEKTQTPPKSPFRYFHLDSGSDVFVGKNARSNTELTFSFAKPHDYFFHVRGYQGSHVILRPFAKKGQQVSKKDIETAASIAAFYSKAKTQKRVPVSYTQRKHLKKSKKGKPGIVVLMREEVIFVDPGLPSKSS
jgi:predicted ribosome quality control (RQC) complex YloA/Tae2 family protein